MYNKFDVKEEKPPIYRPSRRERILGRIAMVLMYGCFLLIFWIIGVDVELNGWRWLTALLLALDVLMAVCTTLFIREYRKR